MRRRSSPSPRDLMPPLVALAIALSTTTAVAQTEGRPALPDLARVREVQIRGSLQAPRPALVVLPSAYEGGSGRYPVLYLLHGLWGSHRDWLDRTNLLAYTAGLPLIVVLPDADDSWYANSATDSTRRFADYIGTALTEAIDGVVDRPAARPPD